LLITNGMVYKHSDKGFTLIELLIVINILAILAGAVSVYVSEYSDEARSLEVYNVFPQIIRSQKFYYMQHGQYYTADHDQLKDHGVDLSEVGYFSYSTFPGELFPFSIRADATEWAPGGWIQYDHQGDPTWCCDGVLMKSSWLPR